MRNQIEADGETETLTAFCLRCIAPAADAGLGLRLQLPTVDPDQDATLAVRLDEAAPGYVDGDPQPRLIYGSLSG